MFDTKMIEGKEENKGEEIMGTQLQTLEPTEIVISEAPELKEVDESRAAQIKAVFAPMVTALESFEGQYNDVISMSKNGITKDVTTKAKTLRIAISKVRIESDKLRKSQKEDILRAGRAIDGVGNILKWAVTEKEESLKAIENHFEKLEAEMEAKIQRERVEALGPFVDHDPNSQELHSMADDVWNAYLETKKKDHEDVLAAEKAANEAKAAKALAEREERERLQVENDRLKKSQEDRDRSDKEEREKRELAEKEERAKRDLADKEEREKRESAEKELAAIKEADRLKSEEAERKEQEALSRGDSDKLQAFISDLREFRSKYEFKSVENAGKYIRANNFIEMAIKELEKD